MRGYFAIVWKLKIWAISLVVELRSPKPLVWVRFLHRPPNLFVMETEICIAYQYKLIRVWNGLCELLCKKPRSVTKVCRFILEIKNQPDREISNIVCIFLEKNYDDIPHEIAILLRDALLPPVDDESTVVGDYFLKRKRVR